MGLIVGLLSRGSALFLLPFCPYFLGFGEKNLADWIFLRIFAIAYARDVSLARKALLIMSLY